MIDSNWASGPIGREAVSRRSGCACLRLTWAIIVGTSTWAWNASDSNSGTNTTSVMPRAASLLTTCRPVGAQWSRKATWMSSSGLIFNRPLRIWWLTCATRGSWLP